MMTNSEETDKSNFTKYSGWLISALGISLVILMMALGLFMLNRADLRHDQQLSQISKIKLIARFRYADIKEIEDKLQPLLNQEFMELNLATIKESLVKHPWIRQVILRKEWPVTLEVTVEEQVPVAVVSSGGYLNSRAEVFDQEQKVKVSGLPIVTATEKNYAKVLKTYTQLQEILNRKVIKISRNAMGAYSFVLQDGIQVNLGRRQLEKRMGSLGSIFEYLKTNELDKVKSIDMRYRNAIAIKLQSEKSEHS